MATNAVDEDYVLRHASDGVRRVWCPACGPERKDKRDRSLSIRSDHEGIGWKCWHCGTTGIVKERQERRVKTQEARVDPVVVPMRAFETQPLTEEAISYLSERGISEEIAKLCGVVSGTKFFRKASREQDAVGFVYRWKDRDYAAKWRAIEGKDFTQDGAAQTLYLGDKIAGRESIVITEGEIDALSFWQAGLPFACSIPSGAMQSANDDDTARLKWMAHCEDMLTKAKNVFLAVDADGPGQATAQVLARRIGKVKCWKIAYPDGCKDANDVLIKHGPDAVQKLISDAKPWPVEGLASPSEYADKVLNLYRKGLPRGMSTGWPTVDEYYTLNPGNLVIVTGVPGHGKSSWLDALLVNAMKQHKWSVAYASFENPPEIHASKLVALKNDKPFGFGPSQRMTEEEMEEGLEWLNRHVTFLTHDGVMPTTQSIIERFESAVLRSGVKACVIDPFNFLKLSAKKDGGVDTEAINEMLSELKMFAQRAEVVVFLVAHPAKPVGANADWVPTGYSISGSAHFYNRADFGLTMHRKDGKNVLHVWKARFAHQGSMGQVEMRYDKPTGGFKEPAEKTNKEDITLDLEGFDESEPF